MTYEIPQRFNAIIRTKSGAMDFIAISLLFKPPSTPLILLLHITLSQSYQLPSSTHTLKRLTLQGSPTPFQFHNSATKMSQNGQLPHQVQYWTRPMDIVDTHNMHAAAAKMRHKAAKTLLDEIPFMLHQLDVGSTWERSAKQSMSEYQLLDSAAQSIDILKAMNIRDRDRLQEEAHQKKREQAPGVLKAMKYWVCPTEMQRTKEEVRELRKRGCPIRCVEDCVPTINDGIEGMADSNFGFVWPLQQMEVIMSRVRWTAKKLQTEGPDGHWAIELLNFYSDGWFLYLDEFNSTFCRDWLDDDFGQKTEAAKQRAKDAEKIVEEVEEEWNPLRYRGWY